MRTSGVKTTSGNCINRGTTGVVGHSGSVRTERRRAVRRGSTLLGGVRATRTLGVRPLGCRASLLTSLSGMMICCSNVSIYRPISFRVERKRHVILSKGGNDNGDDLLGLMIKRSVSCANAMALNSKLMVSCIPRSASCLYKALSRFTRRGGLSRDLFGTVLEGVSFRHMRFRGSVGSFSNKRGGGILVTGDLYRGTRLCM